MAVDFENTAGGSATDFIDFGDLTILDGLSAFSFVCWIWQDARGGGNSSIVRKDGTLTPVQHNSTDNRLNCAIWDSGLTVHLGIPDASFSLGVWHHLAVTWNNSRGSVLFYLDGVLDTTSGQSSTGTIANSANVMRFGATEGGGEAFDGRLDECIYFDRELTAAEVASVQLRRQPKLSGMIGYWRLDEGSGSTSYEFTRNTNDGTITGAAHIPHAPLTYGYGRGVQVLELPAAATTTAEERKSVSGIWLPLIPGVTPNSGKDQEWRQESGWSYSGILAAGGLARSLVGAQPAATGTLARIEKALRAVAGDQPFATGTLARIEKALRALAGDQPNATGVLTRIFGQPRTLTGNQPAATGTLVRIEKALRTLTGNQPAGTGTLARIEKALRTLAGNQPAATGTLVRIEKALRSLAGDQPNATGTLARVFVVVRTLTGNQPAATGTLVRIEKALRSLTGNQPAGTGTLVRIEQALRALAGAQPNATGTLTRREQAFRSLAGSQPNATGTLSTVLTPGAALVTYSTTIRTFQRTRKRPVFYDYATK